MSPLVGALQILDRLVGVSAMEVLNVFELLIEFIERISGRQCL
jgi:hypothetical protein